MKCDLMCELYKSLPSINFNFLSNSVVIFIEWHLKIDDFTVGALPVYWLHPVYYNWLLMHDKGKFGLKLFSKI